ncbi:phosphatase PAP2 family protein [bacterium]|nr:phosphatase PAP2 family protein [bacterium]
MKKETNIDHRISHAFADAAQRSSVGRKLADIAASQLLWFLGGALFFYAYVVTVRVGTFASLAVLAPVAVSWLVTLALEYLIRRRRPFQELAKPLAVGMLWVPPSFPSGHATLAFSIATVFWNMGAGEWIVSAYVIAAIISIGRVAVRAHYVTDVLAGAVVGTVITSFVLSHWML